MRDVTAGGCYLPPAFIAMPQSLSFLLVHIVFSTKDRAPLLDATVRPALHAYLATVARGAECECYRVGGVADHVHLAIRLSRTLTTAKLVEELKTSSSKWLKTQSPALSGFSWQRMARSPSVLPTWKPCADTSTIRRTTTEPRHFKMNTAPFLKNTESNTTSVMCGINLMERAFGPSDSMNSVLGRCPRLGWIRAFGPVKTGHAA